MIRVILPAIVLFILLIGGGGLYVLYENLQGKQTTLTTQGSNENVSPGGTALRMMFENATGQVTKTPDIDLRGQMPPAPDGWYARAYTQEDGEAIVEAELIKTMVSKSTTNNILLDFRRADQAGAGGETMTYMRGQMLMALRMQRLEQLNTNTVQGQILGELNASMASMGDLNAAFNDGAPRKSLFARADGIDWTLHPRTSRRPSTGDVTPVNYRRFTANLGGYIELEIITNAGDAHVAALIGQIDMAALNALLPTPAADYRAGVGVFTASDDLSTDPPEKSMAMKAYEIVNDGRIYPAVETRILQRMVEGDITNWETLIKRNGAGFEPSENILALLGPEPDHIKIARIGYRLTNGPEPLVGGEARLVQKILRGQILSQADARRSSDYDASAISDEVRSLIALLPQGSEDPQSAQAEEPATPGVKPTVRRGASGGVLGAEQCSIELGVRRCVLSDD